jgi:hypothetical protein
MIASAGAGGDLPQRFVCLRGKVMTMREIFLVLWVLTVMTVAFLIAHGHLVLAVLQKYFA